MDTENQGANPVTSSQVPIDQDKHRLPGAFSLFKPSVEGIVLNLGAYAALVLLPVLVFFAAGFIGGILQGTNSTTSSVFFVGVILFGLLVYLLFLPAYPYLQLKSARSEKVSFDQAFHTGLKYAWRFYGISLLVGLIIMIGILLFIVPGIIFIRWYLLSAYYLYDQEVSISEAMRLSKEQSKQFSGALWGVLGVQLLCIVPGFLPVIGFISDILLAMYSNAPAIRYVQIQKIVGGRSSAAPQARPNASLPPSPVQS